MDWRTSKDFGGGAGGPGLNSTGGLSIAEKLQQLSDTARAPSISALLESPNSRTPAATRPRPGEIPPVTLTQIPKVKPSAFTPYLSIAAEYDRYKRAKDHGLEEHVRLSKSTQDDALSPTPSIAEQTITEDGMSKTASMRKGSRGRRGSIAVTPLASVPSVYFDENFHLENPRTFDVVSERSEVIRSTVPAPDDESEVATVQSQRKALATNAILQEKLSWYMDTVEVHLISSISTASSSFFAALGDLRELHSEATTSVQKIQSLRSELVKLDEQQAVKGLEIVRLRRRRNNVEKLERSVKQIERVIASVQQVELSLEQQDIEAALEAVGETERLIAGTGEEGLINLSGVKALTSVNADLDHLRYRIGKAFEARFVECLLSDLRRHVQSVSSTETLRRFAQSFQREQYQRYISSKQTSGVQPPPRSSSLPPEYTVLSQSLRGLLMQHLDGLQRANHVNNAVQAYRDAVIKEAKNLIRKNLPSEGDADSVASSMSRMSRSGGVRSSADKSMALTRALRALGPADAEDLFVTIYTSVSELIRRLGTQQKMLLDVTMMMGETGVGGMLSPRLEQNGFGPITNGGPNGQYMEPGNDSPTGDIASMDISDLISSAVEISQSNIVKLVKVRTEQVARYPLDMFIRYFTLNRLFAQECEAMCVRVGSGLQTAVSNQIREFLSVYQENRMQTLAEGIEKDRWGAKEFEPERQQGVNRIVQSATSDPDEWLAIGRLWEIRAQENNEITITSSTPNTHLTASNIPPSTTNGNVPSTNGSTTTLTDTPEPKKVTHAIVDGAKFLLPESGLLVLRELESYLRLIILMPTSTSELSTSILDFLKLFNSRTFQLILGAGATRSAGLKSITTKHLAMASQAQSIVIALIPYIREAIRRHSGTAPPADFDRLKRTTQEYQNEIHGKLVSIMSDRARSHVNTMKKMDWDSEWTGEASKYYMEVLCKETGVLYKVLNKHFPLEQVICIMEPVFRDYRTRLVEGFGSGVVRTEAGRDRMIRDAETFKERMTPLEGSGNSPEIVLEAVRNKVVAPPAPPEESRSPPPQHNGNQ
ncbi:Vps54-like protein-domain-containing protein [Geopyxis carbonaria]|nr:Vps54-like protein-domain-containing protein [Geopyxis carbonaria]